MSCEVLGPSQSASIAGQGVWTWRGFIDYLWPLELGLLYCFCTEVGPHFSEP